MRELFLGKRPATEDGRDLRARSFADLDALRPLIPSRFGHGFAFKGDDWGLLGNGKAGDCVFAGGGHEEMLYARVLRSLILPFTEDSVLSDYSAVTGYDEDDPSTDQGAYVREVMSYRQHVGLIDGTGARHKIGPYVAIDAQSWDDLIACVYIFGVVGIGFEFPASAWDQFAQGQPWDFVPGSPIEGGHYVPIVGSMAPDREATAITWARRQVLTRDFYEAHNDEAWAYVPVPESLRSDGTGLHHLDTDTLYRDLDAIRQRGGDARGRTV